MSKTIKMSSIQQNENSATTAELVQSAVPAAAKVSSSVPITSATNHAEICSNETSISQQFKAIGVVDGIESEKPTSSLLKSAAASTGPKRLIRKFTMIDPKKLQQAGLDRKIAEALGRQKLMAAVNNLPGTTPIAATTIKRNTSITADFSESTAATANTNAGLAKPIKTLMPPKITITRPAESPTEIKKGFFEDVEKVNSAMRLAHAKNVLNKKLLMKKADQSIQKASQQFLTSTLPTKAKNATSTSNSVSASTAAATLTDTISSATTSGTLNTTKNSKATFIDHKKLPTKPKGTQSMQLTNLKKPSPNKTPEEIARVLDFDGSCETLSSSNVGTAKPKGPPRVLNYDFKPSQKPRQRVPKKTPAQPQSLPTIRQYENAFTNFVQEHVNKHGGSKIENFAAHYDYIPKASIRSNSSNNEVPSTITWPVEPSHSTSPPLSPSKMQKLWTSHSYYTGRKNMPSQLQQHQEQLPTGFPEVSPLKYPFPVVSVAQETPLPTIETVLPFRKSKAAPTTTTSTSASSGIKVETSDSCISSLPPQTNIFEITYLSNEDSSSTSPSSASRYTQKSQFQQSSTGRNLIVLENKVLSQDEKIDLTALRLAQPKSEALSSEVTLTIMQTSTASKPPSAKASTNLPIVIKEEHMEEFIKLPRISAKSQREPKKLILAADKLKLPPEKIAAMAKQIKSQTSEGFKRQSGIIKMPSEIKKEPGIEEFVGIKNPYENTKEKTNRQKRPVSMEGEASNQAGTLDVQAFKQQTKLLTKSTAVMQQKEKSLPIKITNVKTLTSQSAVIMPPPKHRAVILSKAPTPNKASTAVMKDNGHIKDASHTFHPDTSSSSQVMRNKSACEIIEEPLNDAEMSAVDFIASLSSANPITEETTLELSPEELNLNASFAMNLSPIRIPFPLPRDTSSKQTLSRQSSETDSNTLKTSEIMGEMFTSNTNCDIRIGNIVTIPEENVFKTIMSAIKSENIVELKQMDQNAKHKMENLEIKENVISETKENAQTELITTGNRCNYSVDMDIEESYQSEVEFQNLQPIQSDNVLSVTYEIPVEEKDQVLEENNQNFDQRQEVLIDEPQEQNETTHDKIKTTKENAIELQANLEGAENVVKTTLETKIDTNTAKTCNAFLEKLSTSNPDIISDAPKRISRFKKGKVNLVQRKKSTITKPDNVPAKTVVSNDMIVDSDATMKCETSEVASPSFLQSVDGVIKERSIDSLKSHETENTQLDKPKQLIAEVPKKENNAAQLLNPPKMPSKRKTEIGKEIAQALITNILAAEDRTLDTNLVSLIQPKKSGEEIILAPARVPFKKKQLELKTNSESAIGIKSLLRQTNPEKSEDIGQKNEKLGEADESAESLSVAVDKELQKSPRKYELIEDATILKDIVSKDSNKILNKTKNVESPKKTIETNNVKKITVSKTPQVSNAEINNVTNIDPSQSEKIGNKTTNYGKNVEEKEIKKAELVASITNSNTTNLINKSEQKSNDKLSSNIESTDDHISISVENKNVLSSDSVNLLVASEDTSNIHHNCEKKNNFEMEKNEPIGQTQSSNGKPKSANLVEVKDTCTSGSSYSTSDLKEDTKSMDSKNMVEKKTTSPHSIDTRATSVKATKEGVEKSNQNSAISVLAAEGENKVIRILETSATKIAETELEDVSKKTDIGKNVAKSNKTQRFTETYAPKVLTAELKNEQSKSKVAKDFPKGITEKNQLEIGKKSNRYNVTQTLNTVASVNILSLDSEMKESIGKMIRKSKGKVHEEPPCQSESSKGSKNPIQANTELKDELSDSNVLNDILKNEKSSEVKKTAMKRQTRLSIAMENQEKKQPEYNSHETRRTTKSKIAESAVDQQQNYKNNKNKQNKVSKVKKDDAVDSIRKSARNSTSKAINECSSTTKLNQRSKAQIKTQPNTSQKQQGMEEDMEFLPLTPRATRLSTPQKVAVTEHIESTCSDYDDDTFKDESSQELQPVATRKRLRKTFTCTKRKRVLDTETESESEADCQIDDVDGTVEDEVLCHEEFLGFDETSPTNSKMQKSLDMLISATSAEEDESCDEKFTKTIASSKTEPSYKETSSKLKSWLTAGKALSSTVTQQQISPASNAISNTNRSIPLKKRWELTQKTNDDIVVTDDTSPADDDEDEEQAYTNIVRLSLENRKLNNIDAADTQIIAAKKLKLPPVQQIENLENKQIVIKDKAFLEPKPVTANKNDSSDINEVLVAESGSKKRLCRPRKKQIEPNESTEKSEEASLICKAVSKTITAAEVEGSKENPYKKNTAKKLELQTTGAKKQRKTKAKKLTADHDNRDTNEEHLSNTETTAASSSMAQSNIYSEQLLIAMRVEDFNTLEATKRSKRGLDQKIETSFMNSTETNVLPDLRECKPKKQKSPICGKIKSASITDYFEVSDSTILTSISTPTKETSTPTSTKETSTSANSTNPVIYIQKQKPGRKRKSDLNTTTTEAIPTKITKSNTVEEENSFNPRLLLVTNRAQIDTDEMLTENQTDATGITGGPTQCGLCLAHTTRAKWTEHLSKHYGVGWLVGEPQVMVTSRNAVINAIISYFKITGIKGLACRMCSRLYRSALGLINHIETCGVVQARVICEYCSKDYTKLSLPVHVRTCSVRFQQERSLKLQDVSNDNSAVAAEVFNNVGRLKRASLMKAESKLKVIGEQLVGPATTSNGFEPKEHIKYEAPLDSNFRDKWSNDLEKFGKVFCSFKVCKYTADNLKTMEEHLPNCRLQTKPGYHCLLCKKGTKVFVDQSDAIQHVTRKHRNEMDKDFEGESSDCSVKTDDESSDDDCSSGVDSNEEYNDMDTAMEDGTSDVASCKSKSKSKSKSQKTSVEINAQRSYNKVYTARVRNIQEATAKKWKRFIKQNYAKETLFAYALPVYNIVTPSNDSDLEKLLPCQQNSMKFAFSQKLEIKASIGTAEEIEWSQLNRFETADAKSDHFIFLGASIKTIVWAPLPSDVSEQYLLINYRKKYTRTENVKTYQTLVLVYKVMQAQEQTDKRRQSLPPKTQLHYAFSIPDGPVHCMVFLPSGGYNTEMNRLGLLAIGTATNTIKIYALPLTINAPTTSDENKRLNIVDLKPALALNLDLQTEDLSGHVLTNTQCTQICWSETKTHNFIFAGFTNGFIGIWDISDDENLNRFMLNDMRHFVPLNYFYVGEKSIRSLAVHYDTSGPRWLAIAAIARHIYVFDIRDFSQPLLLKEDTVKNVVRSLDWCPLWESFVISYCDAFPNFGRQTVAVNPVGLNYHSSKVDGMLCGVSQTHYTPLQNLFVNATDNGDIVILNTRELHYDDLLPRVQKNCRVASIMDIKLLNGENLSKEIPAVGFEMNEKNYKERYGLVFKPMVKISPEQKSVYLGKERIPPRNVEQYMRINSLRWNFNANACCLVAVGYENGFLRILNFNRDSYFK